MNSASFLINLFQALTLLTPCILLALLLWFFARILLCLCKSNRILRFFVKILFELLCFNFPIRYGLQLSLDLLIGACLEFSSEQTGSWNYASEALAGLFCAFLFVWVCVINYLVLARKKAKKRSTYYSTIYTGLRDNKAKVLFAFNWFLGLRVVIAILGVVVIEHLAAKYCMLIWTCLFFIQFLSNFMLLNKEYLQILQLVVMDATLVFLGVMLTMEEFGRFSRKESEKYGGVTVNTFLAI